MKRKKRINDITLTNKYMLLYGEEEEECKILYGKLNELIENINTKVIDTHILNDKKINKVSYDKKNCKELSKQIISNEILIKDKTKKIIK